MPRGVAAVTLLPLPCHYSIPFERLCICGALVLLLIAILSHTGLRCGFSLFHRQLSAQRRLEWSQYRRIGEDVLPLRSESHPVNAVQSPMCLRNGVRSPMIAGLTIVE